MKRYYKTINNQTVFFKEPLVHDGMQTINPTEEMILAAGWLEWQEPEPTEEQRLDAIKNERLMEIDQYDQSSEVNSFSIQGKTLWLDANLRQQLRTSVMAYQAMNVENVTKWFNGEEYTFPVTAWLQMLNALEVYAAEALNVTESHKAAIKELATIEEVEQYDITAGYPQKLSF